MNSGYLMSESFKGVMPCESQCKLGARAPTAGVDFFTTLSLIHCGRYSSLLPEELPSF